MKLTLNVEYNETLDINLLLKFIESYNKLSNDIDINNIHLVKHYLSKLLDEVNTLADLDTTKYKLAEDCLLHNIKPKERIH